LLPPFIKYNCVWRGQSGTPVPTRFSGFFGVMTVWERLAPPVALQSLRLVPRHLPLHKGGIFVVLALKFGVIFIDCRDRRPRLSKEGLPRGRPRAFKERPYEFDCCSKFIIGRREVFLLTPCLTQCHPKPSPLGKAYIDLCQINFIFVFFTKRVKKYFAHGFCALFH
jgi:hypothetical protein